MLKSLNKYYYCITRKRPLAESKSLDTKLHRCLSTYQLFFYALSQMIGAGIYVLVGHMIKNIVGPATNLSFLLGGIASIFGGLCYCEFSTLIPKAGSCYTYTYLIIGELPAFLVGWTIIMDLLITLASVAKSFSGAVNLLSNNYINNFTNRYMPLVCHSDFLETSVDLIAASLIFVLFLITLTGTDISMNINSFISAVQLCLLCAIIVSSFVYGSKENYLADSGFLPFGFASIFKGAGIAVFSYGGFESLSNSAEETRDPKKSIPIAMFTSINVVIVLYFLASTALSYMVPRLQINESAPFISAFHNKNLIGLKWLTGIATLIATGVSKLSTIYVIPRLLYAMANDGLLFKFFGIIEKKTKLPLYALFVGILISIVLAMFIKIQILVELSSVGYIISFVMIGINLIIFRYLYNEKTEEDSDENCKSMKLRINLHLIFTDRRFFIIILSSLIFSMFLVGLSILFAFRISFNVGLVCVIVSVFFTMIFIIILSFYEPSMKHDAFMTPFMPLAPTITIFLNIILLLNLPWKMWLRFLIWTMLGLIIYFTYGIRNSNLSKNGEENKLIIGEPSTNSNVKTT